MFSEEALPAERGHLLGTCSQGGSEHPRCAGPGAPGPPRARCRSQRSQVGTITSLEPLRPSGGEQGRAAGQGGQALGAAALWAGGLAAADPQTDPGKQRREATARGSYLLWAPPSCWPPPP